MKCPNCKIEQYCGCETCKSIKLSQDKNFNQKKFQIISKDSDLIACGNCGHILIIDDWFDLDLKENVEKLI